MQLQRPKRYGLFIFQNHLECHTSFSWSLLPGLYFNELRILDVWHFASTWINLIDFIKDLNPGPAISPAFRLLGLAGRTISLSKLLSLLKEACAPTSDVTEVDTRMSKTNMVTVKKDTLCSKAKITFTDAKRVAPFYVAFVRFLKINMWSDIN